MASMPEPGSISQEGLRVLRALRESSRDGYSLLSETGLKEDQLQQAVIELGKMVSFKGELRQGRIGETYFMLLPSAYGYADMVIGTQYKRLF